MERKGGGPRPEEKLWGSPFEKLRTLNVGLSDIIMVKFEFSTLSRQEGLRFQAR